MKPWRDVVAANCDDRNSLEERLRKVEDLQAITSLIAAYGPAADTCNVEEVRRIWHAAGTCEIAGIGVFLGPQGLAQAYSEAFHAGIVAGGSAHIFSSPHIAIHGDSAAATNYGTLFWHQDGRFICGRLTAARWEFQRVEGDGWKVVKRTTIPLDGRPEARELLAKPV
jgi:hypothetical protein